MRKIVSGMFVTLDGVVESSEEWLKDYQSEDLGQAVGSLMMAGDTMLLGRVTYEFFAEGFANESGGEADMMNNTPKLVVSNTLKSADWQNSTLINGNVAEKLTELKQQPGKNINVSGSATLVRWLLREGLLDELVLLVFPLARGAGKRLFDGLDGEVGLTLSSFKQLDKGVVQLTYQPA